MITIEPSELYELAIASLVIFAMYVFYRLLKLILKEED